MKELFTTMLLIAWSASFSQSHTISGYIEDVAADERLIGVNVYLAGTDHGTTTNRYGFYSLTVPEGEYTLVISYVGYNTERREIELTEDLRLDFQISSSSEQLQEVEISAEDLPAEQARMSTVRLGVPEIKKIPAFMGEVDIIRAIQLLPGVQSGNEGSTGFYVRGGSPDQNLILLDGVPVYNASHLFGFFSVFNADAIKNVELTKGGFPARFGGRLSSVLEIDMKEGNMNEFRGQGSLGLISSKLTLEGPIVKDKTSFIVSGRRTYYDLIVKPFLPDGINTGYYFADFNAKVNHIFSRKDRLYASYYGGLDNFFFEETYASSGQLFGGGGNYEERNDFGLRWGNHTGSIRWNHLFNDKLFGNLTATYSQYRFSTGYENESIDLSANPPDVERVGFEYISQIRDMGLRYDLQYVLNPQHSLRMGANYTYHVFRPGVAQLNSEYSGIKVDSLMNLSEEIHSNDFFTYIEDDWKISHRWRANYGLHYSIYTTGSAFYHSLQPRVSARYLMTDAWSLKGSYAKMNQYVHLLSNSGIGLPTDLWVSSTESVKPQVSQQIALGSTRNIQGKNFELSAEIYYKWMRNLIEYKEGASFISNSDWQNNVETNGTGKAYGIELLARKNEGKLTGWIGYTLARTTRQFSNLNNGQPYPYKYDRRHDVSLVVNYEFNERFEIGATWVYGTGNTFTAPMSKFFLESSSSFYWQEAYTRYTDRNALRLPAYHRMDLSFTYHKETSWGKSSWNLSLYNAYNRRNPFFLYLSEDHRGEKTVQQVSLFPLIPAITYSFEF